MHIMQVDMGMRRYTIDEGITGNINSEKAVRRLLVHVLGGTQQVRGVSGGTQQVRGLCRSSHVSPQYVKQLSIQRNL